MTDRLDFEPRLGERLRARGALAARPFDAAAIAHQAIVAAGPRRRIGSLAWPARGPVIASLARRPAVAWLIAGLLLVLALLGTVGLAGSPAPSPASLPSPAVVTPPALNPRLTPAAAEATVVALVETGHVGLASTPVVVTKVTLVGAGGTYPYDSRGNGFYADALSWAVEVSGTLVQCSSFCDEDPNGGLALIDDATGDLLSLVYLTTTDVEQVPSGDFRQRLQDNGLVWSTIAAPPAGIVAERTIVQNLDPRIPWVGPILGRISIVNPAATQQHEFRFLTPPAGSALIWWVSVMGSTSGQWTWTAFDAATGQTVLSNAP